MRIMQIRTYRNSCVRLKRYGLNRIDLQDSMNALYGAPAGRRRKQSSRPTWLAKARLLLLHLDEADQELLHHLRRHEDRLALVVTVVEAEAVAVAVVEVEAVGGRCRRPKKPSWKKSWKKKTTMACTPSEAMCIWTAGSMRYCDAVALLPLCGAMLTLSLQQSTLEAGSACQIWVEDADEWVDALIEKAVVHTVPNTDITFRRYTIAYMLPDPAKLVTETDVLVDRLRVKLPEGITLEAAERMVAPDSMSAPPPVDHKIDETTGIGEWSTVEVRTIDESEEAVAQRNAEAEAEEARLAEEQKRLDALEEFTSQGDDAMGAFNPWGGSYKGVALEAPSKVAREEEEIQITTTGSVDFKKRRKADNGKSKKKRIRVETED